MFLKCVPTKKSYYYNVAPNFCCTGSNSSFIILTTFCRPGQMPLIVPPLNVVLGNTHNISKLKMS